MVQNRDISSTFAKGLSVLKSFDDSQTHMSIADVSRKTKLDAATARRLVLTLVHLGYVRKTGRNFSLTPRVLVLAGSFLGANQFGRLVQPILNKHCANIGSGISLAMRDGDSALLVAQSSLPTTKMTYGFTVGSRLPVLQTALGRMLLALEDEDEVQQIVAESDIFPYTPLTTHERWALLESVREAAEQGYCVVREAFEQGVIGIAVPVSKTADARCVIGVSDVIETYENEADLKAMVVSLKRCAIDLNQSNFL